MSFFANLIDYAILTAGRELIANYRVDLGGSVVPSGETGFISHNKAAFVLLVIGSVVTVLLLLPLVICCIVRDVQLTRKERLEAGVETPQQHRNVPTKAATGDTADSGTKLFSEFNNWETKIPTGSSAAAVSKPPMVRSGEPPPPPSTQRSGAPPTLQRQLSQPSSVDGQGTAPPPPFPSYAPPHPPQQQTLQLSHQGPPRPPPPRQQQRLPQPPINPFVANQSHRSANASYSPYPHSGPYAAPSSAVTVTPPQQQPPRQPSAAAAPVDMYAHPYVYTSFPSAAAVSDHPYSFSWACPNPLSQPPGRGPAAQHHQQQQQQPTVGSFNVAPTASSANAPDASHHRP